MWRKIKALFFHNISVRQTVAKNTFWLTVSNVGGRLIRSVIIIYAARVLGASGWGVFSYAITVAAFLTMFVDFGINPVLSREVAKTTDPKERSQLLATTLAMKIVLIALGVLVILFIAPLFTVIPEAKILLPIIALITVFDAFREFGHAFIRGVEKTQWEAAIFLLTNVGIVAFGFIFLRTNPTPKSFALAYAIGTGIGALAAYFYLRDHLKNAYAYISIKLARPLLQSAWPFAASGALAILLTNTDIIIIGWLRTASEVGLFSAAVRIVQLFYALPSIFQMSVLPVFARLAASNREKFRAILERTIALAYLAAIPISLGGFALKKEIITLVFGPQYAGVAWPFGILMLAMIVDFPAAILSGAAFAYNRQKSLIAVSVIAGASNVVFDFLLIPPFGIVGSAVGTFVTQIAANTYLWHAIKKVNNFRILHSLKKIIASSSLTAVVAYALVLAGAGAITSILVSAVIYFVLLKLLKEPLLKEMMLAFHSPGAKTA